MRRKVNWFFLINKRLFKKYSFILMLCLVPFLVWGMRLAAQKESGIVRIALCMRNPEDRLSAEIVEHLINEDSILRYVVCETEESAREMVTGYEADAAWIFPENLLQSLQETTSGKVIGPMVTVVEREDSVPLVFSREILCSAIFPYYTYEVYRDFIRDDLEIDKEEVSDAELREAYNRTLPDDSFFQLVYLDGQAAEEQNYLLAPIRGILALWLVLCGFAASMYYIQDEQSGTFDRIPVKRRLWISFGMQGVLLADAVVILLIACRLAGIFTVWQREAVSAVMLACCTMVFCSLARLLCRTMERLGGCIPILLLGMLILCPVFVEIKGWNAVKHLLPLYYYLKSVHSVYYLYEMALYVVVFAALCYLAARWQDRSRQ